MSDLTLDKLILKEAHVRRELQVSERRACSALGQHRSTQRKLPRRRSDEARLTADIIVLARAYGRYGYRRITALLRDAGWDVSVSRVARIWRREGLKVPARQPKRRRLWLADGSCIRLRPERPNHVWAYDFVEDRTCEGRRYRMLNIVDEFTRECLAIKVARKLNSMDVIETLADLFLLRGVPAHIRSDQGPEFIVKAVKSWRTAMWRASTRDCATNCSTGRSSRRCARHRSSSRAGVSITTACALTPRSATGRPLRKLRHGRLRQLLRALSCRNLDLT